MLFQTTEADNLKSYEHILQLQSDALISVLRQKKTLEEKNGPYCCTKLLYGLKKLILVGVVAFFAIPIGVGLYEDVDENEMVNFFDMGSDEPEMTPDDFA